MGGAAGETQGLLGSTDRPRSSLTSCHLCDRLLFQKILFRFLHALLVSPPRCSVTEVLGQLFFFFLTFSSSLFFCTFKHCLDSLKRASPVFFKTIKEFMRRRKKKSEAKKKKKKEKQIEILVPVSVQISQPTKH